MRLPLRARLARVLAAAGLTAALLLPGVAPVTAQEANVLRVGTTQSLDSLNPYATALVVGYEAFGLTYDLLSDPDHAVHEEYAVWGEKVNYGKTFMGVIRSTFVIDEEGRIAHALYNVRATGHVARVRTLLGV